MPTIIPFQPNNKTMLKLRGFEKVKAPAALILPIWCKELASADLPTLGIPTSIIVIVSLAWWLALHSLLTWACIKLSSCEQWNVINC